ncbi:serine/threonine protein phosphatase [Streptosporangium sp. KLBMP 9127]|nr:serine/threonine protein phosphatase [Streptosporangium sp. KLBMP 9127]
MPVDDPVWSSSVDAGEEALTVSPLQRIIWDQDRTPVVGISYEARVVKYGAVSTALALLSDRQLSELVGKASVIGSGIGGMSTRLEIDGVPVFAKRISLTDLERRPENVMSTANVFGLPTFCQYGVGGPGFGAWRELAANALTTNWALAERSQAFSMMYHWRVLPGAAPVDDEHADIDRTVAYWGGSPAVRERLEAVASASASVVLFLEYIPMTLNAWLATQLAAGADALISACAMVERCLLTDVAFMNTNGLLHFDAHFRNILTDGQRLYFADLGLATSPRFDLSADESDFIARNTSHDLGYVVMNLVNWLVTNVCGVAVPRAGGPTARNEHIRRYAEGEQPVGVPEPLAAMIRRYAPATVVMNDFYWDLFGESRATPYPAEQVDRAIGSLSSSL